MASPGPGRARGFFEEYTRDFTGADLQRLFTRDTPEAYRFFTRGNRDIDLLVLYSDGITEAEDTNGHAFEDSGLEAVVSAARADDPETLAERVLAAVVRHAGDARLADDLTVLAVVRNNTAPNTVVPQPDTPLGV